MNKIKKKLINYLPMSFSWFSGTTWNRTRDTRIFSPVLYHLSYGTITISKNRPVEFSGLQK